VTAKLNNITWFIDWRNKSLALPLFLLATYWQFDAQQSQIDPN